MNINDCLGVNNADTGVERMESAARVGLDDDDDGIKRGHVILKVLFCRSSEGSSVIDECATLTFSYVNGRNAFGSRSDFL